MTLVTRTPMALEIGYCELPNRVTTSFTFARNAAGSRFDLYNMAWQTTRKGGVSLNHTGER
jgi:hypothetical protein